MVAIKLPDGSILEMESGVNGFDIAEKISPSLAKAALAVTVNGKTQDLSTPITTDATVTIITAKDKEGLDILRHSCSHLMAEAIQELWKDVQVTIGPSIENGFYYDFARKEPFTTEDFAKIEAKMHEIVKRDEKSNARSGNAKTRLNISKISASIIKPKLLKTCRKAKRLPCINRETSWICAAGRMCRQPAKSATLSN